jgi:hypothetical protein
MLRKAIAYPFAQRIKYIKDENVMEYACFSLISLSPKKSNKMILEVSEETLDSKKVISL